jgi:hypothetical protein
MLSPKNWKYRVMFWMAIFFALLAWVTLGKDRQSFACKDAELTREVENNEEGVEVYFFTGLCWKT